MIIFSLSYVGIKSAVWINRAAFSSFGILEKKLSLWIELFSILICIFCFWFSISAIQMWFLMLGALIVAPIFTVVTRGARKKQIPPKCLYVMDRLILSLKTGVSLRLALLGVYQRESGWFKMFLQDLQKATELHSTVVTESSWFNKWAHEMIEIEKSRVKVVEQMEAIRRSIKIELDLAKKMKRVTNGPKTQAGFMALLFFSLNIIGLRSATLEQMKVLLPAAWIFFIIGIFLSWCILRLFKWKI